eukprot:10840300-Alexandrium_andersonii.AAC.1
MVRCWSFTGDWNFVFLSSCRAEPATSGDPRSLGSALRGLLVDRPIDELRRVHRHGGHGHDQVRNEELL